MLKSYKYRLYPNSSQEAELRNHLGAARWIYNRALNIKKFSYEKDKTNISAYDLIKMITQMKLNPETAWLSEVPVQSLQQSVLNLEKAYSKFFKDKKSFPKFKKKFRGRESCRYVENFRIDSVLSVVRVPKIGLVKIALDRAPVGTQKSMVVSRETTGKWFVSVLCDDHMPVPEKKSYPDETNTIGIDLGLKDFAVFSDGTRVKSPKFFRNSQKRLAVIQKRASRKKKGSMNRRKANLAVAKCHEKIKNQRKQFIHKVSNEIIKNHDCIALETLSVKNMIKNHKLAKSIQDASWSEFVATLEYKAERKGNRIMRIGRFEPSSKTCSCGVKNQGLKLKDREWTCKACGTTHDRDLLAANNIAKFALRDFYGSQ